MSDAYDVLIVGGGHAGIEAAAAAARMGCRVLLVAPDLDRVGHIACNPAIGGVGKGQLVREIDALGGLMARAADASALQYKTLNRSRGPAVQSPRAQIDRHRYPRVVLSLLTALPGVALLQDRVVDLVTENDGTAGDIPSMLGVKLESGAFVAARNVVVAAGTFLAARLHEGLWCGPGGRRGEAPSAELSDALRRLGIPLRRLRTDTPPRVDARTVDFSRLQLESPDERPEPFAHDAPRSDGPWLPCYSTWTNDATRAAVQTAIARGEAPAVTGRLSGAPPRYCPNIESKIHDYPQTPRHHLFVEPEGRDTTELYINGFSTSIGPESQLAMVRSLPGFGDARIVRFGYAVEYDAACSGSFRATMETRAVRGLFLAGQVCGTSGYEEAAGLGLLAGTNAALRVRERPSWRVGRDVAYLGVLADDLATRESDEPYRLFTSRAEHRLALRADNADLRLAPVARELGLIDHDRAERVRRLRLEIDRAKELLATTGAPDGHTLSQWLCRPEMSWALVAERLPALMSVSPRAAELATVELRYAGYLARQEGERARLMKAEAVRFAPDFDFHAVTGLSREARIALTKYHPETLAQAGRLAGVGPAELSLLAMAARNGSTP